MRKNCVHQIIPHGGESPGAAPLDGQVNEFYADVIERRLAASNLSPEQKIAVMAQVIKCWKARDPDRMVP